MTAEGRGKWQEETRKVKMKRRQEERMGPGDGGRGKGQRDVIYGIYRISKGRVRVSGGRGFGTVEQARRTQSLYRTKVG